MTVELRALTLDDESALREAYVVGARPLPRSVPAGYRLVTRLGSRLGAPRTAGRIGSSVGGAAGDSSQPGRGAQGTGRRGGTQRRPRLEPRACHGRGVPGRLLALACPGAHARESIALDQRGDSVAWTCLVVEADSTRPAQVQGTLARVEHRGRGLDRAVEVASRPRATGRFPRAEYQ